MASNSLSQNHSRIQYVTVKAVIKDVQNRILMLKDLKGNWELPGGKIDFGETPREALSRELVEELSVSELSIGSLVDAWSFVVDTPELSKQYVVLVYACVINEENISISAEHSELAWFSFDEVEKLPLREGYISSIASALKANRQ